MLTSMWSRKVFVPEKENLIWFVFRWTGLKSQWEIGYAPTLIPSSIYQFFSQIADNCPWLITWKWNEKIASINCHFLWEIMFPTPQRSLTIDLAINDPFCHSCWRSTKSCKCFTNVMQWSLKHRPFNEVHVI